MSVRAYEDWESKPGELGTGGVAFSERELKRNRPPQRRFPVGFHAPVYDTAVYDAPVRNRHRGTVRSGR